MAGFATVLLMQLDHPVAEASAVVRIRRSGTRSRLEDPKYGQVLSLNGVLGWCSFLSNNCSML